MSLSLGEKLALLRKENKLSQEKLADALNKRYSLKLNKGMISKWENDREVPTTVNLRFLANYFEITVDLLFEDIASPSLFIDMYELAYRGDPEKIVNLIAPSGNHVKIPILGEIACGEPITAEENIQGYYERSAEGLPSGPVFYLRAKGKSMEPKIPDGSLVLIREQKDVENGEIAAVLVNGDTEATLKRVRKVQGSIILEPLNPDFSPYIVNKENPGKILGKAMEVTFTL